MTHTPLTQLNINNAALNVLLRNGFGTAEAVVEYYNRYGSFVGLQGCGAKTSRIIADAVLDWQGVAR